MERLAPKPLESNALRATRSTCSTKKIETWQDTLPHWPPSSTNRHRITHDRELYDDCRGGAGQRAHPRVIDLVGRDRIRFGPVRGLGPRPGRHAKPMPSLPLPTNRLPLVTNRGCARGQPTSVMVYSSTNPPTFILSRSPCFRPINWEPSGDCGVRTKIVRFWCTTSVPPALGPMK